MRAARHSGEEYLLERGLFRRRRTGEVADPAYLEFAFPSMSTYGAAGAMKDAHAVPMHAIQVLAVQAWMLSRSGLPARRQLWLVALGVAGYAMLFGAVLLRTASGLGPFDPRSASSVTYAGDELLGTVVIDRGPQLHTRRSHRTSMAARAPAARSRAEVWPMTRLMRPAAGGRLRPSYSRLLSSLR
ncbi:MAG TPA: hypothetical protein VFA45_02530 [Actinomycetes bacterium]|nr:hypothetical protein [Actinomycetes bacterium]